MIERPIKPVSSASALGEDVVAIAQGLLDDAIGHMRQPQRAGVETAIHETRKRIKEVRALLRLTNKSLVDVEGNPVRPAANDALRSAARPLGEARDAAVMLQTLDALIAAGEGALFAQDLAPLRDELTARHAEGTAHDQKEIAAALQHLEQVRSRCSGWRIQTANDNAWQALGPNLRRIYRRAGRAMRASAASEDADAWHGFRRRSKDLRYALELLRSAAPELLEPAAKVAKVMTDHLGEDHDLAVLLQYVRASGAACAIATLIQGRSRGHRVAALQDGAWLLAERPRDLARRIASYWCAASTCAPAV